MDKPLEIPDAAYDAACQAAKIDPAIYSTSPLDAGIEAAAPLIVAAAYRARARECNCMHDAELLNCAADELDPQGLTK
jgi:hypothetical protein